MMIEIRLVMMMLLMLFPISLMLAIRRRIDDRRYIKLTPLFSSCVQ